MSTNSRATTQCYVRISDITKELHKMLMPIRGYEEMPLVSLEEAVIPLISTLPDIRDYVYVAKERCGTKPPDGLTQDESASIMLYTMEWTPHNECLYFVLNANLRTEDRGKLTPWLLYLKLILTALTRLPSSRRFLYRGIKMDLSKQYPEGKIFVWWGFSSCTSSIKTLENEQFLGNIGIRTMLTIDCNSGKDISRHSYFELEEEILLLPARQFKVIACLQPAPDLHIIQLKEIEPPRNLLQPMYKNSNLNNLFHDEPITANISKQKSITNNDTKVESSQIQKPTTVEIVNSAPLTVSKNANTAVSLGVEFVNAVGQLVWDGTTKMKEVLQNQNINFKQIIEQCSNHSAVDLHNKGLTDENMQSVVNLAIIKKECKQLWLGGNKLTSIGIWILADALNNNKTLEELYLWKNNVSDAGVISLVDILSVKNHTLKILDLEKTGITNEGAKYLAEMFKTNRTLIYLKLDGNKIGDEGIQIFANILQKFKSNLEELSFGSNKLITDLSIFYLIDMIKLNRSLKIINISSCDISDISKKEFLDETKQLNNNLIVLI